MVEAVHGNGTRRDTNEYINLINAKGIDEPTRMGLMNALGGASDEIYKLQTAGKTVTPQQGEQIIRDHIKNEDIFLDKAGTKEPAVKYGELIITRLHKLDGQTSKPAGTHALQFMGHLGYDENHTPNGSTYKSIHESLSSTTGQISLAFDDKAKKDIQWIEDQAMKRAAQDLPNQIYKDTIKEDYVKTLNDHKEEFKDVKVYQPTKDVEKFSSDDKGQGLGDMLGGGGGFLGMLLLLILGGGKGLGGMFGGADKDKDDKKGHDSSHKKSSHKQDKDDSKDIKALLAEVGDDHPIHQVKKKNHGLHHEDAHHHHTKHAPSTPHAQPMAAKDKAGPPQ